MRYEFTKDVKKNNWWLNERAKIMEVIDDNEDAIYGVECCNSDCNWQGLSNECVTFKHGGPLLCPECHEVVERVD